MNYNASNTLHCQQGRAGVPVSSREATQTLSKKFSTVADTAGIKRIHSKAGFISPWHRSAVPTAPSNVSY
jgi:hypothetical protein